MIVPHSRCLIALTTLFASIALSAAAAPPHGKGPIDRPDELGPYAVGRTTFEVVDPSRDGRTLTVDVWYPADPADADGAEVSVYDLIFIGLPSPVALDGLPVSDDAPFPLVAFSHGNNGVRFQSYFLCEMLASHGFVVAAPDHAGNTAEDLIFGGQAFETRDRPLDISLVISEMLGRSADAGDPFFETLDVLRIGVMGHSFGGFTTMAVASGFQDVPADPRVQVLVPISPAVGGLSDEQLASIELPELVLGGTLDITVPLEPSNTRAFELPMSRPKYRVDVIGAGHNSFTNICDFFDLLVGAGVPPDLLEFVLGSAEEGCGPDLIPIEEAQRVTNFYAVAFLKRELALDRRYKRFLTPGASRSQPVEFSFSFGTRRCGVGAELMLLLPAALWLRRRGRAHD